MFNRVRRTASGTSSLVALAIVFPAAAWAQNTTFQFNIPAEDLGTALRAYARVTGEQVAFDGAATNTKESAALVGDFSADQALKLLLSRSDLAVERSPSGVLMVRSKNAQAASNEEAASSRPKQAISSAISASDLATETVVVAARREQAVTETSAPVTLVSAAQLRDNGSYDVANKLVFLSPSFNYTEAQGLVTATGTRPVSLRGLGIDETLVLVNGHRRHASAVLDTNNGFGRGTVPVDLNAIPADAIERIEILEDGASAQYGSDAIAGVINIVLRKDSSGGILSAQGGITEKGQGAAGIFTAREGFEVGSDGFLTVTAEFRDHAATNFAGIDTRVGHRTLKIGEPQSTDADVTANGEFPLSWGALYADLSFFRRTTQTFGGAFQLPTVFPAVYPNGFLPGINQQTYDFGGTIGAKGSLDDWAWDLSDTVGYDRANFHVFNTGNLSLGPTTQTSFDSGAERYLQNLVDLTVSRDIDLLAGSHLLLGVEHRYEEYGLLPGEPNSYLDRGAIGFPGFNPPSPVNPSRSAFSAFVDGSLKPISSLEFSAAGRFEHYSDFGDSLTGKLSVFWKPLDFLAFRGTLNTGIRAPSLQQQHYASNTLQFIAPTTANPSGLVLVRNAPVDDPIAKLLGATPLKPEKSHNITGGIVLTPMDGLSATADYYRVKITDRIAFSEVLQGAPVNAVLAANGITSANTVRFFTNAADTVTSGYELGIHWQQPVFDTGALSLNAAYGNFGNDVARLQQNPVLPTLPLLAQRALLVLTDSQPKNKITFSGNLVWDNASLNVDVVRFGHWEFVPISTFQRFSPKWQLNVGGSYDIDETLRLQGGILNATNNYPDQIVDEIDGRRFESLGGLGVQGRQYYLRLTKAF